MFWKEDFILGEEFILLPNAAGSKVSGKVVVVETGLFPEKKKFLLWLFLTVIVEILGHTFGNRKMFNLV